MKDVSQNDSNYERMETIRDKVRSFVNPDLKSKKTIYMQKIMLERPRVNTEALRQISDRH